MLPCLFNESGLKAIQEYSLNNPLSHIVVLLQAGDFNLEGINNMSILHQFNDSNEGTKACMTL